MPLPPDTARYYWHTTTIMHVHAFGCRVVNCNMSTAQRLVILHLCLVEEEGHSHGGQRVFDAIQIVVVLKVGAMDVNLDLRNKVERLCLPMHNANGGGYVLVCISRMLCTRTVPYGGMRLRTATRAPSRSSTTSSPAAPDRIPSSWNYQRVSGLVFHLQSCIEISYFHLFRRAYPTLVEQGYSFRYHIWCI